MVAHSITFTSTVMLIFTCLVIKCVAPGCMYAPKNECTNVRKEMRLTPNFNFRLVYTNLKYRWALCQRCDSDGKIDESQKAIY